MTATAEYSSLLQRMFTAGGEFIRGGPLLWVLVSVALFASVGVLLGRTILRRRQKKWNSRWFLALCGVVLLWSGAAVLNHLSQRGTLTLPAAVPALGYYLGMLFTPALIYLHVEKQVSYREPKWGFLVALFSVPVALLAVFCFEGSLAAGLSPQQYGTAQTAVLVAYFVYFFTAMLGSFLSLLMVFYQMPAHMRRPATYMMVGLVGYVLCAIVRLVFDATIPFDLLLGATVALMHVFYHAFGLISSANVIATSRELVLDKLSTLVLVINNEGRILDWNNKNGEGDGILLEPRYRESYTHYRQRLLGEGGGRVSPHDENVLTFPVQGGEAHYLLGTRLLDSDKGQLGYLVEISSVTQVYAVFRALAETATIDQLTGLYNRNAYLQHVGELITQPNLPLLVLVGDVNNLKPTNDIHGHLAGDSLLVSVARVIQACAPPGSFAARIGGDEFVVLAPRCGQSNGETFIRKATAAFAQLPQHYGTEVGVSWGYAVMNEEGEDYNALFGAADKMMYATKRQYARFRSSGLVPDSAVQHPAAEEQPIE